MRRGSEEAAEFVAARWPELAATARLVSGDRAVATEASADALAGIVRRWRSADLVPGAAARADLIRSLALRAEAGAEGGSTVRGSPVRRHPRAGPTPWPMR